MITTQKLASSAENAAAVSNLNKYVSGASGTKWTYVVEEIAGENDRTTVSGHKITIDGSVYYVERSEPTTKDGVITYVVTNRPETYTLPLTGSNGWNKGSLYLLMLLIAVSAVGIYTVNKLKRETQVYAKKQEEN